MKEPHEEGELGRLREAALTQFGTALLDDARRLHRAATGSQTTALGAAIFAGAEVAGTEAHPK